MSLQGCRAESFRFLLKPFTEEQIHTVLKSCLSKLRRTFSYIRVIRNSQWEVNLDMAASVRNNEIILTDGTTLPLSTHYKDTFMKALLMNAAD